MIVRKQNQLEMKMVELGWIGKINKTFVTVRCPDRALLSNLFFLIYPNLDHPFFLIPSSLLGERLLRFSSGKVLPFPFRACLCPSQDQTFIKKACIGLKIPKKKNTSWQVINIWTLIIKHCTFRNQWTIYFGLLTVKLPTIWTSFWNGNATIEKHRTILQKSD